MSLARRSPVSVACNTVGNLANVAIQLTRYVILRRLLPVDTFGIYSGVNPLIGLSVITAGFGMGERSMAQSGLWIMLRRYRQAIRHMLQSRGTDADRHIPRCLYPDDTYLVSYPRSGNTWVRFMLANLTGPPGVEVTFQNIMDFVPDIHQDQEILDDTLRPRFIKSHAPIEPRYPHTIYLLRDGRDVYLSYYHYQREQLPTGTTLADYLQMDHWPCSWGEHVASWLDPDLPEDRFLLIRYEEVYEQPERQLRRIATFIGLDPTEAQIQEAVRNSTFNSMRQIEATAGHPRDDHFSGRFVRSGKVAGWQAHFGPREQAVFKATESENQALVRLGYESNTDW